MYGIFSATWFYGYLSNAPQRKLGITWGRNLRARRRMVFRVGITRSAEGTPSTWGSEPSSPGVIFAVPLARWARGPVPRSIREDSLAIGIILVYRLAVGALFMSLRPG